MKKIVIVICFILSPLIISAQDIGFLDMNIGMSREEVLQAANESEIIEVPRSRDVEFFPVEDRKILTFSVKPEVPHIYLQFYDETLFALTVIFDERHIDYYALVRQIEKKYGNPHTIKPSWRGWELDRILIKVEKPAVVKYIALEDFLDKVAFKAEKETERSRKRNVLLEGL